jgi:integrase
MPNQQQAHKLPIRRRGNKYQVDFRKIKKGQSTYGSKKDVEQAAQNAWNDHLLAQAVGFDFSPDHRKHAIDAFTILKEFPLESIVQAATEYAEQHDPREQHRTFRQLVDEFLDSRRLSGIAQLTHNSYRWKLDKLALTFGPRDIRKIQAVEFERWLNDRGVSGVTRKDYRNYLSILYRFAESRGYTKRNVGAAIAKVRVVQRSPAVLTASELKKLLDAARAHKEGSMLPYFAIGCFCGLRPYELRRTQWEDIDFKSKEIYVSVSASKTNEDRFVEMQDCLLEWLRRVPAEQRQGTIVFARNSFEKVRRDAGVFDGWEDDVMRHSAASHLYKLTDNATFVTAQMGHGLRVFMNHYKRAVSKADAKSYFDVVPDEQ